MSAPITPANFAHQSDQVIINEACARLRRIGPETLTPGLRRLVRSRRPDVMVAGKWLWAQLTGGAR
jgi:hypothetical protein